MEYLKTIKDKFLHVDYDLYLINATDIIERIREHYYLNIDKRNIQLFNADFKYFHYSRKLKAIENDMQKDYKGSFESKEELINNINEFINKVDNNSFIEDDVQSSTNLGYETMPLVVSIVNKDIQNAQLPVELIDGFRRVFYTKNIPSQDILVKVYPQLSDTQWINSMILFNSWKFALHKKAEHYMDRGFRLGFFYRYQLNFVDLYHKNDSQLWKYIDVYTELSPYKTLYNNHLLHLDIEFIFELLNYRPIFEYKKTKNKTEYINTNIESSDYSLWALEKLNYIFIRTLGEIRRHEYELEQEGVVIKRKPFDINMIINYYLQGDLQKHFIKVSKMQVPGFMDNYINSNLKVNQIEFIKDFYFKK